MNISKEKYDFIFKLVIIGNSNCGKSSLLHYFVNNKCIIPQSTNRKEESCINCRCWVRIQSTQCQWKKY